MTDCENMTTQEKYDFIFTPQPDSRLIDSRFDWIEKSFLGDIQTYIDGIHIFIERNKRKDYSDDLPRGGGNIAVPMIICSGLELISSLFAGKSKLKDNKAQNNYDATANVETFVKKYFPGDSKKFPRIFWDGIRNGIMHTFQPNFYSFDYKGIEYKINYIFFVEDRLQSHIRIEGKQILIFINSLELFVVLKNAIENYKIDLEKNEELQDKFITAWENYEEPSTIKSSSKLKYHEALDILKKSENSPSIIFGGSDNNLQST